MIDESKQLMGFDAVTVCIFFQVIGWTSQIIGHGLLEKRAPALKTNALFIFLAPFFVTFEFLHIAFGYKDTKSTDKIKVKIEQDIKEFRASKIKAK